MTAKSSLAYNQTASELYDNNEQTIGTYRRTDGRLTYVVD